MKTTGNKPLQPSQVPKPSESQQKAIEELNGQVLVLAGPGTGKTFTLTERIIHLIQKGADANRILALTFTENATRELHQRLQDRLGPVGRSVQIHTFHGFCQRLIQRHPDVFEVSSEVRPVDEVTRYRIVREAMESFQLEYLKTERGDLFYHTKDVVKGVEEIKKEGVSKEDYHRKVEELFREGGEMMEAARTKKARQEAEKCTQTAGKLQELWKVYEFYNRRLKEGNLTDYQDMILHVVEAFRKREDFAGDVREAFDYLHVDEFQDNNSAQNEIFYALGGEDPNLFVVGDDDQSIFRFQGACLENVLSFKKKFPSARVVTLDENRRSTPVIVDYARAMMNQSLNLEERKRVLGVEKKLRAVNPLRLESRHRIQVVSCPDRPAETRWIASEIRRLREEDPTLGWRDFAILCRGNQEITDMAMALKLDKIPYRTSDTGNLLRSPPVRNLIAFLRAVDHPLDDIALNHAMLFPGNTLLHSDIHQVNLAARQKEVPVWSLLETDIKTLDLKAPVRMEVFRDRLVSWQKLFRQQSLVMAFNMLMKESGLWEFHLLPVGGASGSGRLDVRALEELRGITEFVEGFVMAHPRAVLSDLLGHFLLADQYGLSIESPSPLGQDADAVDVRTVHKAKGSEYRVVFIAQACRETWEGRRSKKPYLELPPDLVLKNRPTQPHEMAEEVLKLEDERRLFYVAATRAMERLYVTYPLHRNGSPSSETIFTLDARGKEGGGMDWKEEGGRAVDSSAMPTCPAPPWGEDAGEFLKARVREISMSPTFLDHYRRCARKTLYTDIYKIPGGPSNPQEYGRAIHEALQKVFEHVQRHRNWPPLKTWVDHFRSALRKSFLERPEDHAGQLKQGEEEIGGLYEWYQEQGIPEVLKVELFLSEASILLENDPMPLRLSGKFDRVDRSGDGSWVVVDYKTGKPKSMDDFLGKLKSSEGEQWDQIRFYALLNRLAEQEGRVKTGKMVYVQNPKKSLTVDISEGDVADIRTKVEETGRRVRALEFPRISDEQNDRFCKTCVYRGICAAGL